MEQFKKELKELLAKYDATIAFECGECSDLHGVYDEKIVAEVGGKEITLSDGYYVQSSDLK